MIFYMSKKTIALIFVLATCTVFLLVLALRTPGPAVEKVTIVPTPTPYAQSILSFEQFTSSTPSANTRIKMVAVNLDTVVNPVGAVQLEIGFDPSVLMITDITAGTFFPNPVQLVKDIDTPNGRISYAIGLPPHQLPLRGKGTIAIISYQVLSTATASATTLTFMPKTQIAAIGVAQSVLKTATPLTLSLVTPTPSVSGSTGIPSATTPIPSVMTYPTTGSSPSSTSNY